MRLFIIFICLVLSLFFFPWLNFDMLSQAKFVPEYVAIFYFIEFFVLMFLFSEYFFRKRRGKLLSLFVGAFAAIGISFVCWSVIALFIGNSLIFNENFYHFLNNKFVVYIFVANFISGGFSAFVASAFLEIERFNIYKNLKN